MGVILPDLFSQGTKAWNAFYDKYKANDPAVQLSWQNLFQFNIDKAQTYVDFSFTDNILPLLSTPLIAMVRTQFVLLPPAAGDAEQFQVVIYGADKKGTALTSYYLNDPVVFGADDAVALVDDYNPDAGIEIPPVLVQQWRDAWAKNGPYVDAAQFTFNGLEVEGQLLGLDFVLGDFVSALFCSNPKRPLNAATLVLRLDFGLKSYNVPSQDTIAPDQIFGLLAKVVDTEVGANGHPTILNSTYYDMSYPNPPGLNLESSH